MQNLWSRWNSWLFQGFFSGDGALHGGQPALEPWLRGKRGRGAARAQGADSAAGNRQKVWELLPWKKRDYPGLNGYWMDIEWDISVPWESTKGSMDLNGADSSWSSTWIPGLLQCSRCEEIELLDLVTWSIQRHSVTLGRHLCWIHPEMRRNGARLEAVWVRPCRSLQLEV